jgi:small conductance mechanosensitive channel
MPEAIQYDEIQSVVLEAAVPILLLIIGALLVLRYARPLIRKVLRRVLASQTLLPTSSDLTAAEIQKRVDTVESLGVSVVRFAVFVLFTALTLAVLNLGWVVGAMGFLIAALTIAGQDFVRDFLAGIFILVENQFYVGDVIRVAGVTGTVEDFTLRRTVLRDLDGTLHVVSNGQIRVAANFTRGHAAVNLDVPIDHAADVDRAMAIIDEIGKSVAAEADWAKRVLEAPRAVRVAAFNEVGVSIRVTGKVRAGEQWAVTGELRRRVLAAFAGANISLPQRRILLDRHGTAPAGPVE